MYQHNGTDYLTALGALVAYGVEFYHGANNSLDDLAECTAENTAREFVVDWHGSHMPSGAERVLLVGAEFTRAEIVEALDAALEQTREQLASE